MDRRSFIRSGLLATLSTEVGCRSLSVVGRRDFPDWANERIEEVIARFRQWRGNDEVLSFVFMTDVHSFASDQSPVPDFADSRQHALFAYEIADRLGCDFMIDGGDQDFEGMVKSPDEPMKRLAIARAFYERFKKRPTLFCLGNHDHGPWTKQGCKISSEVFGETFNGIAARNGFDIVFGRNRSFGYYDLPARRFRILFVNTSDAGYDGFTDDQLDFVEKALAGTPSGWTVAVFGHICVMNEIGHSKRTQGDGRGIRGKKRFVTALEDFVRARPNELLGYFCGDSHYDNAFELRGVNYTISQGFGGLNPFDVPWGARRVPDFDRNVPGTFAHETLFEVVGVKPRRGVFKLFRVGAGGAAFDRACTYANRMEV